MLALHCRAPYWEKGHLSACIQDNYVSFLIPIGACSISLLSLVALLLHRRLQVPSKTHNYSRLASGDDLDSVTDDYAEQPAPPYDSSLDHTRAHEPKIALLEPLALVIDVVACGCFFAAKPSSARLSTVAAHEACSVYLLSLVLYRLCIAQKVSTAARVLWSHSAALYAILWLSFLGNVQADLADSPAPVHLASNLTHLGLLTVLVLVSLTAPRDISDSRLDRYTSQSLFPAREPSASLISRWTFSWVGDLVTKGYRTPLEVHDLNNLAPDQTASWTRPAFRRTLPNSSSLWRFLHFFRRDLLWQGLWSACASLAMFLPAILMKRILEYLEDPDTIYKSTAWLCVVLLLISGTVAGGSDCQSEWIGMKISARLRAIIIGEIYAKLLCRRVGVGHAMERDTSNTSHHEPSPDGVPASSEPPESTPVQGHISEGAITNLMAVDTEKIVMISGNLEKLWMGAPLQLVIATVLLFYVLGPSGLAGVGLVFLTIPLNIMIANRQGDAQERVLAATDARTQLTNEVLRNVRLIKLSAWEPYFRSKVQGLRNAELSKLRLKFIWWSVAMTTWFCTPLLIALTTLFFYTLVAQNELKTSVAFPALAIFALLPFPVDRLSLSISFILQARVSLARIDRFLGEEEVDTSKYSRTHYRLGFSAATLAWPHEASKKPTGGQEPPSLTDPAAFRLVDVNVSIQMERLTIIYGKSGSGKTSLLLGLLGEMALVSGEGFISDNIGPGLLIGAEDNSFSGREAATAYCPQEPWIMNTTLRHNVVFGSAFNGQRYEDVIDACALSLDFSSLEKGDQTLAGDKGCRLSGGQKQRISLARAIYSRAGRVILDDCLSALDARTARHVFFNAIKGPLMHGRTCILATHSTQLTINHCDHAIWLDDGRVVSQGSGEDIVGAGLISHDTLEDKSKGDSETTVTPRLSLNGRLDRSEINIGDTVDIESPPLLKRPAMDAEESLLLQGFQDDEGTANADDTRLEEDKFEGAIGWSTVSSYLTSMGGVLFWIVVLASFLAQQLASLGSNVWIKQWSGQYDDSNGARSQPFLNSVLAMQSTIQAVDSVDVTYYLGVYASLSAAFVLITFTRDLIALWGSLRASKKVHEDLMDSVLGARLSFFDRASLGQILNRFSKDVETVDQEIAGHSINTFYLLALIFMAFILITFVVPFFLLAAAVICLIYYGISVVYINCSRDLRRIESVERSPLYQHFGETVSGYVSIRAFGRTSTFTAKLYDLIDGYNRPNILQWASKEWLTFRVSCSSSILQGLTGAFALWVLGPSNPGAAGLIMTYGATFTEQVTFFVQLYAMVQQSLSSVERIAEYTSLEKEPDTASSHIIPPHWQAQGSVRFLDYTTRYAPELEPVLKGINIEARPGERVAIVGRTGAGKSTLAMALVRALEPVEGSITIDGVDTTDVSLQMLRRAVSIIPQDPTLFDGTLSMNLDPTGSSTDEEMLSALDQVRLLQPSKISQPREAGSNDHEHRADSLTTNINLDYDVQSLSLGQRQLVCIARALLRKARILVLDEATASVDQHTDALIQESLRASAAAGTTVLTIAHRLRSIADYDRVYVLDAGRVVEEGTVSDLLSRNGPDAVFRGLCAETGELEAIERAASTGER